MLSVAFKAKETPEKNPMTMEKMRIVITRAKEQAGEFSERHRGLGAEVIEFPTILIRPPESYEELDKAIFQLSQYEWVIFTSVNGVKAFFERLESQKKDESAFLNVKICAIGPATAMALNDYGLAVDLIPEKFQAEGILESWKGVSLIGQHILLPRAVVAREVLPEELRKAGALVNVVSAYRTVPAKGMEIVREEILDGAINVVTFTSPSTVENFCVLFSEEECSRFTNLFDIAVIGPITRERAEAFGLIVAIEANPFTISALTDAIVSHFKGE